MPPRIDVNSYLPGLRAVITAKWNRGYTKRVIPHVESFYVDSSLDNDADSWQIQLGDPTGDYLAMMNRDNEIRVELLSADPGGVGHIMTGISDDLVYDQDGLYTITGRDYASLALDSTAEPQKWKRVKPTYVIANQARKLGFTSINVNNIHPVKKIIKTDGSETYWEFWYRLVRTEHAYLWVGPNGALIANTLNYSKTPTYYFGTPMKTDPARIQDAHIPVEGVEIRKSTQGRIYKVWVNVHNGRLKTTTSVYDGSIGDWVKRPTRIIQDNKAHTISQAKKTAREEIYEGKVGAVEIRLVISDPRFMININRMCRLRIPEIDLYGHYFITGVKVQAGTGGFIQEIRLREKYMALTNRVPEPPRLPSTVKKAPAADTGEDEDSVNIHSLTVNLVPGKPDWGDYFWRAAAEHHGEWDFDIFLAWLIAVAQHETGWNNYREHGCNIGKDYLEWFPWKDPQTVGEAAGQALLHGIGTRQEYELTFANQIGTHGLSFPGRTSNPDVGVGPFQLTSRNLKHNADDWYDKEHPNTKMGHDEYEGGRWDPEANIMEGARYFKEMLDDTHMHPDGEQGTQMAAMTFAYSKFHHGPGGGFQGDPDAISVGKNAARFLDPARAAYDAWKQAEKEKSDTEGPDVGTTTSDIFPLGWPNNDQILAAFKDNMWFGKIPSVATGPLAPGGTLPEIQFLQAKQYRQGRFASILWLVIHTMEDNVFKDASGNWVMGDERENAAQGTAQYFSTLNKTASAHYCIDPHEIWQCVHDQDTAYGTTGIATGVGGSFSTNDYALHFEHGGSALQSAAQWADNYSQTELALSAQLVAQKAKKYGIQVKHLSIAEIQAGVSGIVGHVDINNAFQTGDHTDPGVNFPWAQYIQMVKDAG